jgi:hypothetical protein
MSTLSVIVASCGRPTLARTLESVCTQMVPGDELFIDVNDAGDWGHRARNRLLVKATGDYILFCDDDDLLAPGALEIVRAKTLVYPGRVGLFKMRYADGREIWDTPELIEGQCSTGTIVVPNIPEKLGRFGNEYAGDFVFAKSTAALYDQPPLFHPEVISLYRP